MSDNTNATVVEARVMRTYHVELSRAGETVGSVDVNLSFPLDANLNPLLCGHPLTEFHARGQLYRRLRKLALAGRVDVTPEVVEDPAVRWETHLARARFVQIDTETGRPVRQR